MKSKIGYNESLTNYRAPIEFKNSAFENFGSFWYFTWNGNIRQFWMPVGNDYYFKPVIMKFKTFIIAVVPV